MNPVRIAILAVAAIAAIALAIVLRNFTSKPKAEPAAAAAPARPMARVLAAARDLPVGTRLAAADIPRHPSPADGLNAAFITDGARPEAPKAGAAGAANSASEAAKDIVTGGGQALQALVGNVVKEPIVKGEPIL